MTVEELKNKVLQDVPVTQAEAELIMKYINDQRSAGAKFAARCK